jgi:hypothetical protein
VHKAKTDAPATAMANGRGCRRTSEEIMPKPRRARSNRLGVVGDPTRRFYQRLGETHSIVSPVV